MVSNKLLFLIIPRLGWRHQKLTKHTEPAFTNLPVSYVNAICTYFALSNFDKKNSKALVKNNSSHTTFSVFFTQKYT